MTEQPKPPKMNPAQLSLAVEKYRNEKHFHEITDSLVNALRLGIITTSELHVAVALAAHIVEETTAVPAPGIWTPS